MLGGILPLIDICMSVSAVVTVSLSAVTTRSAVLGILSTRKS